MKLKNLGYATFIAATAIAFVIGSGGPSQAKKKAKEAAPAPQAFCLGADKPVCATKGGLKFTYANSCYAAKDGAKSAKPGACKAAKAHKKGGKKKMSKPAKKKEMKPAKKKATKKKM
jgi:hypothetical protein